MKNTLFVILVLICGVLANCHSPDEKKNILIVADEWPQMHVLAQYIEKKGEYKIDSIDQENIQSQTALYDYDAIFMYIHSKLLKKAEQALIEYVNNGEKLIVLHHGIASSKMNNPKWLEFMGIQLYPRDHKDHPWKVLHDTAHIMVNLSPGHFITTNNITYKKAIHFNTDYPNVSDSISGKFEAFELPSTEIFLNQRFTGNKNKKLLYGLSTKDNSIMQPTSGWYQKAGQGWVFYFQAGHSISDFENENFRQILLNTLKWQQ